MWIPLLAVVSLARADDLHPASDLPAADSLDVAVRLTGLRANAERGWTPTPLAIAQTSEPLSDSRIVTLSSGDLRVEVFAGAVVEDRVPLNVRVWRSKGRREELIASPTLTADVGQQVTITQGERVPVIAADGTVAWRFDGLDLALTYHAADGG